MNSPLKSLWKEVSDSKLLWKVADLSAIAPHEESEIEPGPEEVEDYPEINRLLKDEAEG